VRWSVLVALLALMAAPALAQQSHLQGRVLESASKTPLAGAVIVVSDHSVGTLSDEEGRFSLAVGGEQLILEVNLIGYRPWQSGQISLVRGDTLTIDIQLEINAISLREITVTPGRFAIMGDATGSRQALSQEEIQTIPQFGEDIFRSVTRLPGVTGNDYSARFTIRGGEQEEVLVRLDGVELFEPFHLKDINGGALSIVDVNLIEGVDLLTGGFGAEYGDRLSGVFDVTSRRPEAGHRRASVGLSMMNVRALVEGADEDRSWLISARRGYLDIVLALMGEDEDIDPVYSDLFAKFTQTLNSNHEMQWSLLHSSDEFDLLEDDGDESVSTYGNTYGWFTLRSTLRPDLFVQSTASVGRVTDDRVGQGFFFDGAPEFNISDIRDVDIWSVRQDWSLEAGDDHFLKWGFDVRRLQAHYDYFSDRRRFLRDTDGFVVGLQDTTDIESDDTQSSVSVYATDRFRLSEKLTAELGLRYDDVRHTDDRLLSPRLHLAYALSPATSLRVAWGLYHQSQGIHQLAVEDGESAFHPAQRSEHRVLGLEHITRHGVQLRLEAYDKQLTSRRPAYRNWRDDIEIFSELADDRLRLDLAGGHSRGIELYAKRDTGTRLSWWASYSLAQVRDEITSFGVQGRTFPFVDEIAGRYDQRHTMYADVNIRPTPRWKLNLAWQYRTGWPYTQRLLHLRTAEDGSRYLTIDLGNPLAVDYPVVHRLDARLNRTFHVVGGQLQTFFEVTNLYNHDNVSSYFYEVDCGGSSDVADCFLRREADTWFGLLPSLGVSLTWDL